MFADRSEAGRLLAQKLRSYAGEGVVVLGVPRGGVEVASVVAADLGLPLDLILAKKIGHPFSPEWAVAAVGSAGLIADRRRLAELGVPWGFVEREAARLRAELNRRAAALRGGRKVLPLAGREALIVDDGAATGHTLIAAIEEARRQGARRAVVAVPVASLDAAATLRARAEEFVALQMPSGFRTIGEWYADFSPVDDEEVRALILGGRAVAGRGR